jgi:glutathione S-transferase
MGLKYQVIPQGFPVSDAYKAINSLGTLPFLEDDGGVQITESVAAMLYLAEQYGPTPLLPHKGDPDLGRVLQMAVFGEATLGACVTPIFLTGMAAPDAEKKNWTVNTMTSRLQTALKYLSDQLGNGPFLAGSKFTLADISVGYAVGLVPHFMDAKSIPANLAAYHERLTQRPAYQRAAAVK